MEMELLDEETLNIKEKIRSIVYYPSLNVLCASVNSNKIAFIEASSANLVKIYDLQRNHVSNQNFNPDSDSPICVGVFNFKERLLVCKDKLFNARSDINGTLLVDSILQPPITKPNETVLIDLPSVDANQFLKLLQTYVPNHSEEDFLFNILDTLSANAARSSSNPKSSHKLAKWETVTFKCKHSALLACLTQIQETLPSTNLPSVPVLCSIIDRLKNMMSSEEVARACVLNGDKEVMNVEAHRRISFEKWPHMNYKWALPEKMAQAGFFYKPAQSQDDRALCFNCNICLVTWEPTDEPWSEHERHSAQCPFVKGDYTTNIPLAVTYSSEPARLQTVGNEAITVLSSSSSRTLVASLTSSGDVTIWDLSLINKKSCEFKLSLFPIFTEDAPVKSVHVDSACVIDRWTTTDKENDTQTHALIVGASVKGLSLSSRYLQVFSPHATNVLDEAKRLNKLNESIAVLLVFEIVEDNSEDVMDIDTKSPVMMDIEDPDEWKPPSYEEAIQEKMKKLKFLEALDLHEISTYETNCSSSNSGRKSAPLIEEPTLFSGNSVTLKQMILLSDADLIGPSVMISQILPTSTLCEKDTIFLNARPRSEEDAWGGVGGVFLLACTQYQSGDAEVILEPKPVHTYFFQGAQCPRMVCLADSELSESMSTVSDDTMEANGSNFDLPEGRSDIEPMDQGLPVTSPPLLAYSSLHPSPNHVAQSCKSGPWIILTMGGDILIYHPAIFEQKPNHSGGKQHHPGAWPTNPKLLKAASPDPEMRFVCMEYCTGMDRLCAATAGGEIHFFHLVRGETEENTLLTLGQAASPEAEGVANEKLFEIKGDLDSLLVAKNLEDSIIQLHDLIQYEILTARINASLPPCWSEVHQDQLSRQAQPVAPVGQQTEAGLVYSRVWKLVPDVGTWDEHVIELGLPKVCSIGHIDVKIHLADLLGEVPANIYVTLLRQNVSNAAVDPTDPHLDAYETRHGTNMDLGLPIADLDVPFIDDPSVSPDSYRTPGRSHQPCPVSQDQLRQLHADIIAGPYCLADYLDLSGQVAVIPMTSSELIKCRSRLFAIHLKAMSERPSDDYHEQLMDQSRENPPLSPRPFKYGGRGSGRGRAKYKGGPGMGHVGFNPGQSAGPEKSYSGSSFGSAPRQPRDSNPTPVSSTPTGVTLHGCDAIRQLSVSVRRFRRTTVPMERTQRVALLRSSDFHERLLHRLVCGYPAETVPFALPHLRHLALNLLNWIAVMDLNELNFTCQNIPRLLSLTGTKVEEIIVSLLIGGDRAIAKKTAKFLMSLIELEKLSTEGNVEEYIFIPMLDQALKNRMELLLLADSSVGVQWYFILLDRLDKEFSSSETTQIKARFLQLLTHTYRERNSTFEATILRSAFGLFHNPLDATLFDVEFQWNPLTNVVSHPPKNNKPTYAAMVVTGPVPVITAEEGPAVEKVDKYASPIEESLLKDVLKLMGQTSSNVNGLGKKGGPNGRANGVPVLDDTQVWQSRGLIEVEPLHIACDSTSEGTRLEKINTQSGIATVVPVQSGAAPASAPVTWEPLSSVLQPFLPLSYAQKQMKLKNNLMKLHQLKKQMVEAKAKLSETKKMATAATPYLSTPPTPKTTPATTTQTTPMQSTPSVTPPNEAAGRPGSSGFTSVPENKTLFSADVANHHLITAPEPHQLVVERMHSGARRYVVLTFGEPVLLTDILIPPCSELSSLSIEVSLRNDDTDTQRLTVSTDIANHPLILTDIQPPVLCQFMKITIVGRMGTTSSKAKIPLGCFYGRSIILPWELSLCTATGDHHISKHASKKAFHVVDGGHTAQTPGCSADSGIDEHVFLDPLTANPKLSLALNQLRAVSEDMTCRYGMASYHLGQLLEAYKNSGVQEANKSDMTAQIKTAYQLCCDLQRQLNVITHTFQRVWSFMSNESLSLETAEELQQDKEQLVSQACTDKIRILLECCLQSLLGLAGGLSIADESTPLDHISLSCSIMSAMTPDTLSQMFTNLVVFGNRSMQVMGIGLLSHMCSVASITSQINLTQWWSSWIREILNMFFSSSPVWMVPQNRIFVLLCALIQKMIISGLGRLICEDLLIFLDNLLMPLTKGTPLTSPVIDQEMLNWVLLLTNTTLDYISKESSVRKDKANGKSSGNRWDFLTWHHTQTKDEQGKKSRVEVSKLMRRKLHKRLLHHKQKLMDLKTAKEEFMSAQLAAESDEKKSHFTKTWIRKKKEDEFNKHLRVLTRKHVRDIMQLKKGELGLCRRFEKKLMAALQEKATLEDCAAGGSGSSPGSSQQPGPSTSPADLPNNGIFDEVILVPYSAVKPVVQGLFALLHRMDSTVNSDLFLRTCKVIGRLMMACQPILNLGEVITGQQLYDLLERACQPAFNSMSSSFAGPYGLHALACLLADLLEAEHEPVGSSGSTIPEESLIDVSFDNGSGNEDDEEPPPAPAEKSMTPGGSSVFPPPGKNFFYIESNAQNDYPETLDSDSDTDIEFLEELKVSEEFNFPPPVPLSSNTGYLSMSTLLNPCVQPIQRWNGVEATLNEIGLAHTTTPLGITAAYDLRSESGLQLRAECIMRRWGAQLASRADSAVNAPCPPADANCLTGAMRLVARVTEGLCPRSEAPTAERVLDSCLNTLLCNVTEKKILLEPVLQIWLYLNQDILNQWSSSNTPCLSLTPTAVISLLSTLARSSHLSTLNLGLRALVLVCNQRNEKRMVGFLLASAELRAFLLHLMCMSVGSESSGEGGADHLMPYVGPATLSVFEDLLSRLRLYCADLDTEYIPFLADLLMKITQDNGPLALGYGPRDLQCKLILAASEENFVCCDTSIRLNLVYGIARLAMTHMSNKRQFQPSLAQNVDKTACFTSVSSVGLLLKQDPDKSYHALCSRDRIITALMALLNNIISTSGQGTSGFIPGSCNQTTALSDDQKKEQENNAGSLGLADIIVRSTEPVHNLLSCLNFCRSKQIEIVRDVALPELASEIFDCLQPRSVGDWVLVALKELFALCKDRRPFLDIALASLKSPECEIHEPLLLFIVWILSSRQTVLDGLPDTPVSALQYFVQHGGVLTICEHLLNSCRHVLGSGRSLLQSTEIALSLTFSALSGSPAQGPSAQAGETAPKPNNPVWYNTLGEIYASNTSGTSNQRKQAPDMGTPSSDGLINFSPFCTISSVSSVSSSNPETLLQAAGPYRRSKPANWTYNFFPDESYIELTLRLPCVVLLQEIVVRPHMASLSSTPSAVSLEFRRFGCIVYPLTSPIDTAGLVPIRLQFSPTLANEVILRFHKPKHGETLGLSTLSVRGSSLFSCDNSSGTDNLASMTRLRLLDFILQYADVSLVDHLTNTIENIPDLQGYFCSLLTKRFSESSTVEQILLNLGSRSPVASKRILQCLLKTSSGESGPVFFRSEESESNERTENLLFRLGVLEDCHTPERVEMMINWLHQLKHNDKHYLKGLVPAKHIYTIAAVLWHWVDKEMIADGWKLLTTPELVRFLFDWAASVPRQNGNARSAVSCLLCSLCAVKPDLFALVLEWMGIPQMARMTDDSKSQHNIHSQLVSLCDQLDILATAVQSDVNVSQLMSSGFLDLVTGQLGEFFINHLRATGVDGESYFAQTDTVKKTSGRSSSVDLQCVSAAVAARLLRFLHDLGDADWRFKEWLGSNEASLFWAPLVMLLYTNNQRMTDSPKPRKIPRSSAIQPLGLSDRIELESAAVDFFKAVTKFSEQNQAKFAHLMHETLTNLKDNIEMLCLPDFLRRLLLQVMLEDPTIPILLRCSGTDIFNSHDNNQVRERPFVHPRFGAGYGFTLKTVSAHTTVGLLAQEILEMSSLAGSRGAGETEKAGSSSVKPPPRETTPVKFDNANYGLELIDHITSVTGLGVQDKAKTTQQAAEDSAKEGGRNAHRDSARTASAVDITLHQSDIGATLPTQCSLNQVLFRLINKVDDDISDTPRIGRLFNGYIELRVDVHHRNQVSQGTVVPELNGLEILCSPHISSPLESFIGVDGLVVLAELLHLLYHGIRRLGSSGCNLASVPQSGAKSLAPGIYGGPPGMTGYWPMDQQWPDEYYDVDLDTVDPLSQPQTEFPYATYYNKRASPLANAKPGLPLLPAHSLIAFALFLRLPGYAEMLLKEWREAIQLLRLLLGVCEDSEGADFLAKNCELPLLPFRVLKRLYMTHQIGTDDAAVLRRRTLDLSILELCLACLSVLSHQPPSVTAVQSQIIGVTIEDLQSQLQSSGTQQVITSTTSTTLGAQEEKKHYWAKGTGFSTGTVTSTWDSEFALMRQKLEEEHCTVILEVLAAFLHPGDDDDTEESIGSFTYDFLPQTAIQMLQESCLLTLMASYLRNDSVLDMARHVPLYQALLAVLRSIARIPEIHTLLQPQDPKGGNLDIGSLLASMKTCVDTYANRLRKAPIIPKRDPNKSKLTRQFSIRKMYSGKKFMDDFQINQPKSGKEKDEAGTSSEGDNESEGLAQLIPDIQRTARLVEQALKKSAANRTMDDGAKKDMHDGLFTAVTAEEAFEKIYCLAMKPLQFGMHQMVKENEDGSLVFLSSHQYEQLVRQAVGASQASGRARRLAQETVTLSTSLPLSASSTVFVRCDEERLDLMKVLIIGPPDTPYANGCFEFDVFFPMDYPASPPLINLQTTGNHSVRFNPNLYNEGKVCLSILNTWHGRPEERWNSKTSSFLQVLVSIQSLILVSEPYFNEPGYERSRGTPSGTQASRDYDANIRQATVKWAILEQIKNPPACFKEVVLKHFKLKKDAVLRQVQDWISDCSGLLTEKAQTSGKSTTKHAVVQIKKYYRQLKEEMAKLDDKKPSETLSTPMAETSMSPPKYDSD